METEIDETPSAYILPYLKQYQFAQTNVHLGCDKAGEFVVTVPDHMIWGENGNDGRSLRMLIDKIAEPNAKGQIVPLAVSRPFVTFSIARHFREAIGEEKI